MGSSGLKGARKISVDATGSTSGSGAGFWPGCVARASLSPTADPSLFVAFAERGGRTSFTISPVASGSRTDRRIVMRRRHDAVLPGQLQLSVLEAAERVTRSGPPAQPPDRSPVHVGCSNSVYARLYASLVVARGGGAGGSRVGGQFVRRGRAGGSRVGGQFGRCGRPGASTGVGRNGGDGAGGGRRLQGQELSHLASQGRRWRLQAAGEFHGGAKLFRRAGFADLPQDRRLSHIVRPDRREWRERVSRSLGGKTPPVRSSAT